MQTFRGWRNSLVLSLIAWLPLMALPVPGPAASLVPQAPGNPVVAPPRNSHDVARDAAVSITYDEAIKPSTVSAPTFAVQGMQTGTVQGTYTVNGGMLSFAPDHPFKPGELVQATATTRTLSLQDEAPLSPTVWQFRVATAAASGTFQDSSQAFGTGTFDSVAMGDLDVDGDLDAVVTNRDTARVEVWLNSRGSFSNSGQNLSAHLNLAVELADVDGDGDLDLFIGGGSLSFELWLNDGRGIFTDSGRRLGSSAPLYVVTADIDGDGNLDALVSTANGNELWLNDGLGQFVDSGQRLGTRGYLFRVMVGDVDGDGDLDVITRGASAGSVFLNNGAGIFSASGETLGSMNLESGVLGDLDEDGDLDAFVRTRQPAPVGEVRFRHETWRNDGSGHFVDTGVYRETLQGARMELGDAEGDGDLDAFVLSDYRVERLLNDGTGAFGQSQLFGAGYVARDLAVGDLDGDGDLDVFMALEGPNRVWLNGVPGQVDLQVDFTGSGSVAPKQDAYFSVTVTNKGQVPATGIILNVTVGGYFFFWLDTGPFSCPVGGKTCTLNQLANGATATVKLTERYGDPSQDELYYNSPVGANVTSAEPDVNQLNNTVSGFVTVSDGCSELEDCWLWFFCTLTSARLNAEPVLTAASRISQASQFDIGVFYRVRDKILRSTGAGRRYIELYYQHAPEIQRLLLADGALQDTTFDTLLLWQPHLEALVEGTAATPISSAEVAALNDVLDRLVATGSPELRTAITTERGKLPALAGMTMEEARGMLVGYGVFLPAVHH